MSWCPPVRRMVFLRRKPAEYTRTTTTQTPSDEVRSRSNCGYKRPDGDQSRLIGSLAWLTREGSLGEASEDLKFGQSAVAGFGMLLRNSDGKGSLTYSGVIEIAGTTLLPEIPRAIAKEFLAAVQQANDQADRGQSPLRSKRWSTALSRRIGRCC